MKDFSAGAVSTAIRTEEGHIYTGICIDLACGLGFCAEASAIAEMLKHRETHIIELVALTHKGPMAPCGRCREMMVQVDRRNLDCRILIGKDRYVTLQELLPEHWLFNSEEK